MGILQELTRLRDQLSTERREFPWVKIEKNYIFDGPSGKETLADLFDGHSQLIIYHFMFGPAWKEGCHGCSFLADHIDGANLHLMHHDVSLVVVSRAPLPEFEAFKRRMGWRFKWVSSYGSDFNYDAGDVFHTYSSYARGLDLLLGAYNYLDLTPKGRNETTTMDWVRHHDRYDAAIEPKEHHS